MIENIKTDSKNFYSYARKFSKSREEIGPLQDGNGNIITEAEAMANILANQYNSVFSTPRENYQYDHMKYNCENMSEETSVCSCCVDVFFWHK